MDLVLQVANPRGVPSVPRLSQAENTSLGHQESIADNGFELSVPGVPGVPSQKRVFPKLNAN